MGFDVDEGLVYAYDARAVGRLLIPIRASNAFSIMNRKKCVYLRRPGNFMTDQCLARKSSRFKEDTTGLSIPERIREILFPS